MGGRASRQKGNRREREMVVRLQALPGVRCHRVPLSGALGGDYSGDLVVDLSVCVGAGPPLRAEVKGRAGAEGWRGLKRALATELLVILTHADVSAVAVTWEAFAGLVAGEGMARGYRGDGHLGTTLTRWTTVRRWLGANSLLFLVEDRQEPLVVLTWDTFAQLVAKE